jgi:tight adherence protein C
VITQALPDALDLVLVTIQAGHLPLQALRIVAPSVPAVIGDAFAEVVARVDRGQRFRTSLHALGEHLGVPALALESAIAGAAEAGTAVGPALDRLAQDARDHRRRIAEAGARELPIRLSFPLVLCTLPSFVLIAIVPLLLGALSSLRGH